MSARLLGLGTAVATLGGLLAVSWFIFVQQEHKSYWHWPGILGLALTALGFIGLIAGFAVSDRKEGPVQQQRGGRNSINLQAGRDITINDSNEDDRQ